MSISSRKYRVHDTLATVDVTGWSARQDKAEQKIEHNRSTRVQVIRRARAAAATLAAAKGKAQDEFDAMHRPVASPLPPMVHPDVADLVARFLADQGLDGTDLLRPLHGDTQLEEIRERYVGEAQAEYDAAMAAVLALPDDDGLNPEQPVKARPVPVAPAVEPTPVPALPPMPKRARGRPRKDEATAAATLSARLAAEGIVEDED